MNDTFGIDLGSGSIKVISLNKDGNKIFLESVGEIKSPGLGFLTGEQKAIAEMEASIKLLMSDMKLRRKKVVVALPEDQVISRMIKLPALKENEIKDALMFEAETFVPYPLNEVSIDYEVIQSDATGLLVFAIAAKKDLVASYLKLFKKCGLEIVALESPSVSIRRLMSLLVGGDRSLLFVDIGEKYSNVVGISKGNLYFTRSMSVGGESLTRAISLNLGLDMNSAEEYKKAYGINPDELEGKIKNALMPVFSSMAEELRKAIVAYKQEWNQDIELLVLSGGGANMPGLTEELARILGLETQVIQPFLKVDMSRVNVPINVNSEGCRFSLVIGLALRGLI